MASIPKRKSYYKPVPKPEDVVAEWVSLPDRHQAATVRLNGAEYTLRAWLDDAGEMVGARFTKPDQTAYDLDLQVYGGPSCDCPDYTRHQRACKHCCGLVKLMKALPEARLAAEQQQEQQADQGDVCPWYSDAEIDAMYRESLEEEALASGRWFIDDVPDEAPSPWRFGVGA